MQFIITVEGDPISKDAMDATMDDLMDYMVEHFPLRRVQVAWIEQPKVEKAIVLIADAVMGAP